MDCWSNKRFLSWLIVGLVTAWGYAKAHADDCAPAWDNAIGQPGMGGVGGGGVHALVVWNGNLFAGGNFTSAGNSEFAYRTARWDGSAWNHFNAGLNARVNAMTVFDGQLIAGGYFTDSGGTTVNGIASWTSSNWPWQPLGSGVTWENKYPGDVHALTVYNGELIAGGYFDTAGGVPSNSIARWNGTTWQPLGSGMIYDEVYALTVYNGELIAGGSFSTAGGVPANSIARWNGTSWQPLGNGVNGDVYALSVYEGELIVGGAFYTAGTLSASNIARWNGTSWQPLGNGVNGNRSFVYALSVYEGELIVGGWFNTAGTLSASNIARWNGTSWQPLGNGVNSDVYALSVYGEAMVVGGVFTFAGGLPSNRVAMFEISCSTGACCIGDDGCLILTESECIDAGGLYAGADVPCSYCDEQGETLVWVGGDDEPWSNGANWVLDVAGCPESVLPPGAIDNAQFGLGFGIVCKPATTASPWIDSNIYVGSFNADGMEFLNLNLNGHTLNTKFFRISSSDAQISNGTLRSVGNMSFGNGNIALSGDSSMLECQGFIRVVGGGSSDSVLTIEDGASVIVGPASDNITGIVSLFGLGTQGIYTNAELNITGKGSSLETAAQISLGNDIFMNKELNGAAYLNVLDGATVVSRLGDSPTFSSGLVGTNPTNLIVPSRVLIRESGSSWTQDGYMRIGWNGRGELDVESNGYFQAMAGTIATFPESYGRLTVDGIGSMADFDTDLFVGGSVNGNGGEGIARVLNGGVLNVGQSLTVLPQGRLRLGADSVVNVNESFVMSLGGVLRADISPRAHGQLSVGGNAELTGTLDVRLVDGANPSVGQSFHVLTANRVNGFFDAALLPDLGPDRTMFVQPIGGGAGSGGSGILITIGSSGESPEFGEPETFFLEGEPTGVTGAGIEKPMSGVGRDIVLSVKALDNNDPGNVLVLINNGDGTGFIPVVAPVGREPSAIVAADLQGIGHDALAVTNRGDNSVTVLLNDGRGGFDTFDLPVGVQPSAMVAGDFRGLGLIDLAVTNEGDGTVTILLNDGKGGFDPQLPIAVGSQPVSIAAGTLLGGPAIDLAIANSGDGTVTILQNTGSPTEPFDVFATINAGSNPLFIDIEDLDNNKTLDIVVFGGGPGSGALRVLRNLGGGNFGTPIQFPLDGAPLSLALWDMDSDGDVDVVAVVDDDDLGPVVRILRNDTDPKTGLISLTLFDPLDEGLNPRLVTGADVTGEGNDDLVTVNVTPATIGAGGGGPTSTLSIRPNLFSTTTPGDLNGDGVVNVSDLLILLGQWGTCADPNNCPADLNDDGVVNVSDLLILLANWGG